ncbi:hypothetical protein ACM66B_000997 [Microbotryomycetes sp. NB124-2]
MVDAAGASPPGYSAALVGQPAASVHDVDDAQVALVNLVPGHGSASFLLGHLGYGPASLAGEIQVKWLYSSHASVEQLKIVFRGVERGPNCSPIELVEHSQILWGIGAQSTSSAQLSESSTTSTAVEGPGPLTPFKLELTPDLPHCIHNGPSPDSSLEYTLTAVLSFSNPNLPPATHTVPVHLARTLSPGALGSAQALAAAASLETTSDGAHDQSSAPSVTPQIIAIEEPVPVSIRLARTVFTRSEPVELAVKVPVPSAEVVQKEGLRLRTISAELVRKIAAVHVEDDKTPPPAATGPSTRNGDSAQDEIQEVDETSTVAVPTLPNDMPPHVTVLARSGKSARFSLTRPIVIRLLLHPPKNPSCESVSQSTILHNISFEVRVTIGLIATSQRDQHQNRDWIVSRTVYIVPDYPVSRSDKQKEVDRDNAPDGFSPNWLSSQDAGPAPTYLDATSSATSDGGSTWTPQPPPLSPLSPGSSGAAVPLSPPPLSSNIDSTFDEEYDGYEDISASLTNLAPPPAIDEDVSPPSPGAAGTFVPISTRLAHEHGTQDTSITIDEPPPESEYGSPGNGINSLRFIPLGTTSSPSIPSSPSSLVAFSVIDDHNNNQSLIVDENGNQALSLTTSTSSSSTRTTTTTDSNLPPPYAAGRVDDANLSSCSIAVRRGSRRELQVSSNAHSVATSERNVGVGNEERGQQEEVEEEEEEDQTVGPPPEYSSHSHEQHQQQQQGQQGQQPRAAVELNPK